MNIYLPYVYKVTNRYNSKFYIGMRSANTVIAEEDLGKHYFTSNKTVQKNFLDFDTEIIAYFKDFESAFMFENNLIKENWGNPLLLNKHYQKDISSFSMKGHKRPDLSEYNRKTKTKPKEIRTYVCTKCSKSFEKEEHCHHKLWDTPVCSASCKNKRPNKNKGKSLPQLRGKPAWNKGIPNPKSAENARKGAKKLSETAKGRKRKYLSDGTWTWEYHSKDSLPADSVIRTAGETLG